MRETFRDYLHGAADFVIDHPWWSLLLVLLFSVAKGISEGWASAVMR